MLKKTSKNCHSVQCEGVKFFSSKVWVMGCLNFCLKVTRRYQLKNWKYCFLLDKTSKNCQSVQLQGVKKISPKVWVMGCLNFCLKVTKIYQLTKIWYMVFCTFRIKIESQNLDCWETLAKNTILDFCQLIYLSYLETKV